MYWDVSLLTWAGDAFINQDPFSLAVAEEQQEQVEGG